LPGLGSGFLAATRLRSRSEFCPPAAFDRKLVIQDPTMLRLGEQVQESEVLRSWALAEFSNPERWTDLPRLVRAEVIQQLRDGGVPTDENDWSALVAAIQSFRQPLLQGLLPLQIQWHSGELTIKDLSGLRVIAYQPFVQAASAGTVGDLVSVFDRGGEVDGGKYNANVHRISAAFDEMKIRGRPIIVAPSATDPLYLVEGYTRCSAMVHEYRVDHLSGQMRVPVFVGVTPRLFEWDWVKYLPH
jgi:hypothetical protein